MTFAGLCLGTCSLIPTQGIAGPWPSDIASGLTWGTVCAPDARCEVPSFFRVCLIQCGSPQRMYKTYKLALECDCECTLSLSTWQSDLSREGKALIPKPMKIMKQTEDNRGQRRKCLTTSMHQSC